MLAPPGVVGLGHALLDFVFPRLCCGCQQRIVEPDCLVCATCIDALPPLHEPLCTTCGCPDAELRSAGRCTDCPVGSIYFARARGAYPYAGAAKAIIERLKYHGRQEYADLMARLMMVKFYDEIRELAADRIVAVPLHRTRQRERGFNQAGEIAEQLGKRLRVPVSDGLMRRLVATPSQTRLTRKQRAKNIRGAFRCVAGSFEGERLILIDDVYTTGATLNECARELMETGQADSIYCYSFARAVLD